MPKKIIVKQYDKAKKNNSRSSSASSADWTEQINNIDDYITLPQHDVPCSVTAVSQVAKKHRWTAPIKDAMEMRRTASKTLHPLLDKKINKLKEDHVNSINNQLNLKPSGDHNLPVLQILKKLNHSYATNDDKRLLTEARKSKSQDFSKEDRKMLKEGMNRLRDAIKQNNHIPKKDDLPQTAPILRVNRDGSPIYPEETKLKDKKPVDKKVQPIGFKRVPHAVPILELSKKTHKDKPSTYNMKVVSWNKIYDSEYKLKKGDEGIALGDKKSRFRLDDVEIVNKEPKNSSFVIVPNASEKTMVKRHGGNKFIVTKEEPPKPKKR